MPSLPILSLWIAILSPVFVALFWIFWINFPVFEFHIFKVLSLLPERILVPFWINDADRTSSECPGHSKTLILRQVDLLNCRSAPSLDPASNIFPSGENATELIAPAFKCFKLIANFKLVPLIFHSLKIPSLPPDNTWSPSGEKATERISHWLFLENVFSSLTKFGSHILKVLSEPPESSCFPSGEKATELTAFVCPLKTAFTFLVLIFHSLTVLSLLPESANLPSREKATEAVSYTHLTLPTSCLV